MPLPKPDPDEKSEDFISRCMADDAMNSEYPDKEQRYAICQQQVEAAAAGEPAVAVKPELVLYGVIGEDIIAKDVEVWLRENASAPEISIRMASDGGDVFAGITIMNAISRHPGRKIGIVDGIAASMMSAIMCACDYIQIAENGYVMVHNPLSMVEGGSDELRRRADLLDKVGSTLLATYQRRMGLPEQKIKEIMSIDSWYTAQEALQAGLVDEIIAATNMAASISTKKPLPPKIMKAIATDRMKSGLSEVMAGAGGATKQEDAPMKIDMKELEKKFPGANIQAIVAAIRAQEGGEEEVLPSGQQECEKQGYFWYENQCHKEPKPPTAPSDAALAAMPTTPEDCREAGYYWYDDRCNVYPERGATNAAEEGGVPMSQEECEAAGKYWYDDACHDKPKEGEDPAAEKSGAGGTTITITMARLESRIKAMGDQIKALNRKTADQIAARVLAGSGLSDETIHDLTHTVVRPCHYLDQSGNLDDRAYEAALRKKVEAYGGSVVEGFGGGMSAVNMDTPEKKAGYDREYLRKLRAGRGGKKQ